MIVAAPLAASALVLAFAGVETRDRGLEELTSTIPAGSGAQLQGSDA